MEKRLYRSQTDRVIMGVCGGLAKYFAIDPVIVRLIFILLIPTVISIVAYIILAFVVPVESSKVTEPKDVIRENVEEMKETASQLGQEIRSTLSKEQGTPEETIKIRHRSLNILGIIIIVIGVIFLLVSFNLLWWLRWKYLWPLILVAIGLLIIFGSRRK